MGTIHVAANVPPAPRSERELLAWARAVSDLLVRFVGPLASIVVVRADSIEVPKLGVGADPSAGGIVMAADTKLILDGAAGDSYQIYDTAVGRVRTYVDAVLEQDVG